MEREKEMIDAKQPYRRPLIDVLSKRHDSLRRENLSPGLKGAGSTLFSVPDPAMEGLNFSVKRVSI
jgi:homoserine kinase